METHIQKPMSQQTLQQRLITSKTKNKSCAYKVGYKQPQTVAKMSHHKKNAKKTKKRRGNVSLAKSEDHCEAEKAAPSDEGADGSADVKDQIHLLIEYIN